jgi:hypothetical protein
MPSAEQKGVPHLKRSGHSRRAKLEEIGGERIRFMVTRGREDLRAKPGVQGWAVSSVVGRDSADPPLMCAVT